MGKSGDYFAAVANAVGAAYDWTRRILFREFSFTYWCALGLVVFMFSPGPYLKYVWLIPLKFLSPPLRFPTAKEDPLIEMHSIVMELVDWGIGYVPLIISLAVVSLVLFAVVTWVSSIAHFLFIDGVARGRMEIRSGIRRYTALGRSLFFFRIGTALLSGLVFLVGIAVSVIIIGLMNRDTTDPSNILVSFAIFVVILSACFVISGYINLILFDGAILIAYRYGIGLIEASGYVLRLFAAHWIGFVTYGLVQWALAFGVSLVAMLLLIPPCCLLYCGFWTLQSIPVFDFLSAYALVVLLLPIRVFFRAMGPAFLEELNPDYAILGKDEEVSTTF